MSSSTIALKAPLTRVRSEALEHQEPEVSNRDATDPVLARRHVYRHQSSRARSLARAAFAVSGASYQYSSSKGPISVSTLALGVKPLG